jgi:aminopeptidase N
MPRTPDRPLQVNPDSPVDLSRYREYYIAHEIAHQWWGQAVTGERYRDQWLSEGLAQFAAVQYLKAKLGERTFAGLIRRFSQWTERKSKWGPITLGSRLSYLDFDAYQAIVYNKSAVALNMLLDLLGEEVFFKGLREFFEKYKYRSARTNNFIRSMEQVAGRDLKQFFKGWFDSHLLPEVHVARDIRKESDGFVLKFRVSQTRDVFVFPLWVEWEENGKKVRQKFEVSAATQEFEFHAASRPAKIKINPDKFVPGNFN